MADDSLTDTGLTLWTWEMDELDDLKRERDRRQTGAVSRSEVAREAIAVGLAVLDQLEDDRQLRHMDTREKRVLADRGIRLAIEEARTGDVPDPGEPVGED